MPETRAARSLVLLACLLVYLAGWTTVPRRGFVTVDLGAIHLQVHQLATAGHSDLPIGPLLAPVLRDHLPWRYESTPPGPIADFSVLRGGWIVERDGRFIILYPITYAALASLFQRVLGSGGPPLFSILTALLAVLATLRLAHNLALTEAASGGLLLGLATPLALYAILVWGHAPATAGAALGWLALCPPSGLPLTAGRGVLCGLAFGLCGAFRNEGLLLAALVPAALLTTPARRAIPAYALGLALALAPMLAYNASAFGFPLDPTQFRRAAKITGTTAPAAPALTVPAAPSRVARFLATARESLFGADNLRPFAQSTLAALHLTALVLLALALNASSRALARPPLLLLTTTSGLYVLFALIARPQQVPGLFIASPALLPGLALLLTPIPYASPALRAPALAAAAFIVACMLRGSPGWQWGGRYLLPAVPLLAVLAIQALERLASAGLRVERVHRHALLAIGLALSLIAYRDVGSEQRFHEAVEQSTIRAWRVPAVAFDHWWFSWENAPLALDHELFFTGDPASLARLLAHLSGRQVKRVAFVSRAQGPAAPPGWRVAGRRVETLPNGRPWAALLLERP